MRFFTEGNQLMSEHMVGPNDVTDTGTHKDYDVTERLPELVVPTLFLSGRYDFRLEYSPAVVADVGDPASNAGPSLFTALTEQLGLKLQPESVSLPVLVVENIERPTPD